jgi:hypothetical protein
MHIRNCRKIVTTVFVGNDFYHKYISTKQLKSIYKQLHSFINFIG